MADAPVQILELKAGSSPRVSFELKPGKPVEPMSLGRNGTWPLDAPDILDVHAYMYFDGHILYVQSADARRPAKFNGRVIGTDWVQMEIPSTIEIGRARLVYRTLEASSFEDDEKTMAKPMQVPVPAERPFQPGAFANRVEDDETTRFSPMDIREPDPTVVSPLEASDMRPPAPTHPQMMQQPIMKPRPAAGAAPLSYPPPSSTTAGPPPIPVPAPPTPAYQGYGSVQVAQSGPYPPQPGAPADTSRVAIPPNETFVERAKREWKETSLPKKVMLGLTPAVIWAVVAVSQDEPEQPVRRPRDGGAEAAVASTVPTVPVIPSTVTTVVTTATVPIPVPSGTTPEVIDTQTPPTPSASASALPRGKKTMEREASDAVAAGNYALAAQLYDQLAAQHPDRPVYREAARIMKQKMKGE